MFQPCVNIAITRNDRYFNLL